LSHELYIEVVVGLPPHPVVDHEGFFLVEHSDVLCTTDFVFDLHVTGKDDLAVWLGKWVHVCFDEDFQLSEANIGFD